MTQDENPDFTAALDVVKNYLTEADANYQKNKDLHIKLEAQVSDLKADVELLGQRKIAAHQELEVIAEELDKRQSAFETKRQDFEQSLADARKLQVDLEGREKAVADKLNEANVKLDSADKLMKELRTKEYQLRDLEGVIASRR